MPNTPKTRRTVSLLCTLVLAFQLPTASAQTDEVNFPAGVVESHQMIPMRDGARLSAWLYFPAADGKWPVLFEQRYASLTGRGTREAAARLSGRPPGG